MTEPALIEFSRRRRSTWPGIYCVAAISGLFAGCSSKAEPPTAAQSKQVDHFLQGQAYLKSGDVATALREFDLAVAAEPRDALVYAERAKARQAQGDLDRSLTDFTRSIELDSQNPSRYLDRAGNLHLLGRLDDAAADCDRALQLDPQSAGAYSVRGATRLAQGRFAQAVEDCTQSLKIKPTFSAALNNRGLAHLKLKEYSAAIADLDRAIELNHDFYDAFLNRGVAHRDQGEDELALADWDAAIRLAPKDARAYYNRAELQLTRGQYTPAVADYTHVLTPRLEILARSWRPGVGPPPPNAGETARLLVQRSAALVGKADAKSLRQAIEDCSLAIQLRPSLADAFRVRGAAYIAQGDAARGRIDQDYARAIGDR